MHKIIPIAILIAITSCKKNGDQIEPTTAVAVKEYGSNAPVAGANVTFAKNVAGNRSVVFTGVTNDKGICQVPTKYFNDAGARMDVSAAKYWPPVLPHISASVVLNPEGWIRIFGIQTPVFVYPGASFISLYPVGQSSGRSMVEDNFYPVDTYSILVRAYAGEANTIVWKVLSSNSDTLNRGEQRDIMVPKFDTIDIVHLSGY